MRTGAARGRAGHFHEAGFYASDDEFRALILPFAEDGIAAGEPVILGYDERKTALLRSWLSDPPAVTFIADQQMYATPALAIASYRRLFEQHAAAGAGQIRIAGEVPHQGNGGRFDGWDRYEWAVNTVWGDFPVWGRCLYDTATAPTAVLDAVERTHPRLLSPAGPPRVSRRYQPDRAFEPLPPPPDPLEATIPAAELTGCTAAGARHAVTRAVHGLLPAQTLDDLVIGTSEAVSNALRHGRPPVTVRIWTAPERAVIHVHDEGPGPADPLTGLVPGNGPAGGPGLGLWVVHQLRIDAALMRRGRGFAVRLRGGVIPG